MTVMALFPDGSCNDTQRDIMCKSVYLGRLDCHQSGTGNVGGMSPMSLVELNVDGSTNFVPRRYQLRNRGSKPDMGFGFAFAPISINRVHKSRVLVVDFSKWTLRHYIHFLCK